MNSNIIEFIKKERVGVLSVVLADGTPHSATVHFSESIEPLKFFIQTTNSTTKVKPFLSGEPGKAAFVIGFSEKDWLTLQMRGSVRIVSDKNELEEVCRIHYKKQPAAEEYKGPQTVFLEFTPTWYRFTDFNTDPETIIENSK
jgi:general stress protein 26